MCGGDALADQKKKEAQSQADLNDQLTKQFQEFSSVSNPFWENRLKSGLPFMNQLTDYNNGTLARSFAPARAAMNRNLAGFGDTLPSGFKAGMQTQFDEGEGQAFDQNMVNSLMMNDQAKTQAAGALNPLAPASVGSGAASSVLSAPPVQSGGFGNFVGGLANGFVQGLGKGAGAAGPMAAFI